MGAFGEDDKIRVDVFTHRLKTNIAINLAVLLALAMILIDLVIIITSQRDLIRSEISKGHILISVIENNLIDYDASGDNAERLDFKHCLDKILYEAGFSCALVLDRDDQEKYFNGTNSTLKNELVQVVGQTMESGRKMTRLLGTTWGVFWQQKRNLIISAPLFRNENVVAGAAVVLPLGGIYQSLRHTQHIIFTYILINTIIFTLAGLYLLSKVIVKPVHRLVKRADEYKEDDEIYFLTGKEDNEFNKLSKSLNRMLKRISEDKEKLKTTVKSLEKANYDLKQAQKDIVRAEKLASVGRLSSGIAHEIGNPIGIVMGYLELLKQQDVTDEEKKEFIIRTGNEINRINTIIQQLLDLSRQSKVDLEAVSVHEIINDIAEVLKFQPLLSNIKYECLLSADKDTVMADPDQLRQVFLNIIINAADAISSVRDKSDGKIIITSKVIQDTDADFAYHPSMLKVMFIDNGPGISEDNLGNIFDPFYTTKEPGKGTGLGLSVCFMIVQGIGGEIKVTSKEDTGTTIAVYLPVHSD